MIRYELKAAEEDKRGYPRLDLVFYDDGKHPILADASYWPRFGSGRNFKLVNDPPRGKYLRALCIFLLLAKYRDSVPGNEKGDFLLRDKVLKNSWLATLGSSFGNAKRTWFFKTYFEGNAFVTVGRGSSHTAQMKARNAGEPASATYLVGAFKLENLLCFSIPRSSATATRTPLEGVQLAQMAETLQQYWTDSKSQKWERTVHSFVADIDSGRSNGLPAKRHESAAVQVDSQLPFTLSARWRDLGDCAFEAMSAGGTAGNWYVISITTSWLRKWKDVFCNAVIREGARVRLAHHSPDAGRCPGVKTQWDMYFRSYAPKGQTAAEYARARLLETRKELREWAKAAKAARKRSKDFSGAFEFYESYMPHPHMAILHTPIVKGGVSWPAWGAPEGTKCFVGLYSYYPEGLEERCGLFLHSPSPMLDLYYKSVVRFFEFARKDRYIKPVHL